MRIWPPNSQVAITKAPGSFPPSTVHRAQRNTRMTSYSSMPPDFLKCHIFGLNVEFRCVLLSFY